MPIKLTKIKIFKIWIKPFLLMSQGPVMQKIRFLGQKLWPVACAQTHGRTHKVKTEEPFSGFWNSRVSSFSLWSRSGPIMVNLLHTEFHLNHIINWVQWSTKDKNAVLVILFFSLFFWWMTVISISSL